MTVLRLGRVFIVGNDGPEPTALPCAETQRHAPIDEQRAQ